MERFPLLTLFYLLPEAALREGLGLDFAPRNPIEFVADDYYLTIYAGRMFSRRLMALWAKIMWAAGGMTGFESDYSKDNPMNILTHDSDTCLKVLSILGYDTDWLATQAISTMQIPYADADETVRRWTSIVRCFWESDEIKAREVYEIAKAHRAHEDFTARKSNARIDFHRKYYHTRAKSRLVPIQSAWEEVEYVPDIDYDLDHVIACGWVRNFYRWLGNKKDIDICKLRYMDYTQQQIADHLKYKNHSGVTKRLKLIADILEVYVEWQWELEQDNNAPPPPKLFKRNPALYQPKDDGEPWELRYISIPFAYQRKIFAGAEES
jgi:hypothetical protein